jgi:hypothetical protein
MARTDREVIDSNSAWHQQNSSRLGRGLAAHTIGDYVTLQEIARAWRVPRVLVHKIFHQLAAHDSSISHYAIGRGRPILRIPMATFERVRREVNKECAERRAGEGSQAHWAPYPEVTPASLKPKEK